MCSYLVCMPCNEHFRLLSVSTPLDLMHGRWTRSRQIIILQGISHVITLRCSDHINPLDLTIQNSDRVSPLKLDSTNPIQSEAPLATGQSKQTTKITVVLTTRVCVRACVRVRFEATVHARCDTKLRQRSQQRQRKNIRARQAAAPPFCGDKTGRVGCARNRHSKPRYTDINLV